jgi:hypothetical protein
VARPEKPINWDDVEFHLMAGATQEEICATVGLHRSNFIPKFYERYGSDFTTYATEKRSQGLTLLKSAQLRKALSKSDKGSTQMLMWLGKVSLGQKEPDTGTQQYTTIKVNANDRLRSGSRLQSEGLSDSGDSCTEQRNEEGSSGMAPTFG